MLHFIFWLCSRNIFIFTSRKKIIAVADCILNDKIDAGKNVIKIIDQILINNNLKKYFKIVILPNDIKFTEKKFAEKYVLDSNIQLLIWGDVIENNTETSFDLLKYTCRHQGFSNENHKRFFREEVSRVSLKYENSMRVQKTGTTDSLYITADNIFENIMFIIGLCFQIMPRHLKGRDDYFYKYRALDIFTELLNRLSKEKRLDKARLSLIDRSSMYLYTLYRFLCSYENNPEKRFVLAKEAIRHDFNKNNFVVNANLASGYWRDNNLIMARKYAKRTWEIKPRHTVSRLNKGFIYFLDSLKKRGLKEYKMAYESAERAEDMSPIFEEIDFLIQEISSQNLGKQFLLVVGWLNYWTGNKEVGKEDLMRFLEWDKDKNDKEYKSLEQYINNI
jgi:hypothetical protein